MIQIRRSKLRLLLAASWVWPLILLSAHYLNVHWHRPVPGLVLGFGYGLFYAILTFRIDREIKGNGKEQSDEHPEK